LLFFLSAARASYSQSQLHAFVQVRPRLREASLNVKLFAVEAAAVAAAAMLVCALPNLGRTTDDDADPSGASDGEGGEGDGEGGEGDGTKGLGLSKLTVGNRKVLVCEFLRATVLDRRSDNSAVVEIKRRHMDIMKDMVVETVVPTFRMWRSRYKKAWLEARKEGNMNNFMGAATTAGLRRQRQKRAGSALKGTVWDICGDAFLQVHQYLRVQLKIPIDIQLMYDYLLCEIKDDADAYLTEKYNAAKLSDPAGVKSFEADKKPLREFMFRRRGYSNCATVSSGLDLKAFKLLVWRLQMWYKQPPFLLHTSKQINYDETRITFSLARNTCVDRRTPDAKEVRVRLCTNARGGFTLVLLIECMDGGRVVGVFCIVEGKTNSVVASIPAHDRIKWTHQEKSWQNGRTMVEMANHFFTDKKDYDVTADNCAMHKDGVYMECIECMGVRQHDLVEYGTYAQQPCDRLFKRFKASLRRRWMMWLVKQAKDITGKISRPPYRLWQEWIAFAIEDLETKVNGVTPIFRAFAECGMGPDPRPNHDLQGLLDAEVDAEEVAKLKREAEQWMVRKRKRAADKKRAIAEAQRTQSPGGESVLDMLHRCSQGRARSDDDVPEIEFDAEQAWDLLHDQ
jgi:hypothetical protein